MTDLSSCPCYDIRQQCSAFVYGMEMADAFVRTGKYRRILLVGAEVHSHSLDYSTRGRDVMVLCGDGAGAVVIGPVETDDPREGILYTKVATDSQGTTFDGERSGPGVAATAVVGYRFIPRDGGVTFGLGFTPLVRTSRFLPWGGANVGYAF